MFYDVVHMDLPTIGDFELAVLLTVVRLGDDAFGANVRRALSERTGRTHSVGAVYTTLQRLEEKALVASSISEPTSVRGGRSKRCYGVTRLGSQVLRHARQVTVALWAGVRA